jgi:dihydroxyacetone kinase
VLLVNNLGGVSELELGAVGNEAVKWLRAKGIVVKRFLSGTYMVSSGCLASAGVVNECFISVVSGARR